MSDPHNQNDQFLVNRFVDDPIVTDAKPAEPREFALEGRTSQRLVCQTIDGFD